MDSELCGEGQLTTKSKCGLEGGEIFKNKKSAANKAARHFSFPLEKNRFWNQEY